MLGLLIVGIILILADALPHLVWDWQTRILNGRRLAEGHFIVSAIAETHHRFSELTLRATTATSTLPS
jgi:hypothetical protein